MADETMEAVAYRMVAPVALDFSKVVDMAEWNRMLADLAADDMVMAAAHSEMHKSRHTASGQPQFTE